MELINGNKVQKKYGDLVILINNFMETSKIMTTLHLSLFMGQVIWCHMTNQKQLTTCLQEPWNGIGR